MTINQGHLTNGTKHSERRAHQRLRGLWWAIVLIWAGLVLGADNMAILPSIGDADAASWIFLGAGVFGILGALYRLASSNVPGATAWDWVWSCIWLIVGLGGFTYLEISWPLVLILLGVISLVNVLLRRG